MADEQSELTLSRVSSSAVHAATGRDWPAWLEALDTAGAVDWDHKQIVAHLEGAHPEVDSGWWRQTIAVGYEQARGKRIIGQTADAGFQVGVQRSVTAAASEVWHVLTSRPELWLGVGASIAFRKGERYEVPASDDASAATGEVRVVKPGERLRMTWQPADWSSPATVQLTLTPSSSGKTAIRAHLERLPDAEAREAMRARWRQALEGIAAAV